MGYKTPKVKDYAKQTILSSMHLTGAAQGTGVHPRTAMARIPYKLVLSIDGRVYLYVGHIHPRAGL